MVTVPDNHAQVAPVLQMYDDLLAKFPYSQLISERKAKFEEFYQGDFEEEMPGNILVNRDTGTYLADESAGELKILPVIGVLYENMGSDIELIARTKAIPDLANVIEPVIKYEDLTKNINDVNLGNLNVALRSKYKGGALFADKKPPEVSDYLVEKNGNTFNHNFKCVSHRYVEDKTGKITGDEDLEALFELEQVENIYDSIKRLEESGKLNKAIKNLEKDAESQRKKVDYPIETYKDFHDIAHWFLQEQNSDEKEDESIKFTEYTRIQRILAGAEPHKEKRSKKKIIGVLALIAAVVGAAYLAYETLRHVGDDDDESGNAHRPSVYIDVEKNGAAGLDVTCDVRDPLDAQPNATQLEILVESMGVELYKRVVDIPGVGVYKERLPLDEIEAKQIVLKQNAGQDLVVNVRAHDDKGFGEDEEQFDDNAPLTDVNLVKFYEIVNNLQKDNTPEAQAVLAKLADAYQDPTPKRLIANETLNVFVDHVTGEALGITETEDNDYLTIKDSSFLADIENRVDNNNLSKTMEALGDLVMNLNEGNNGGLSAGTIDDFYHGTLIDSLRESAIADVLEKVFEQGTGVEAHKVFNFGFTKRIDDTYMIEPSWGLAFMENGEEVVYNIKSKSIIPTENFIIDQDSFNNVSVEDEDQKFVAFENLPIAIYDGTFYNELFNVMQKRNIRFSDVIGEKIASGDIRDDQTQLNNDPVEITVGKIGEL